MKRSLFLLLDRHESPTRSIASAIAHAEFADTLGFHTFWIAEHHFRRLSVANPSVLLAAIAARTKRIRIGPAVAVLPYRDPVLIAEDYALVDQLSGPGSVERLGLICSYKRAGLSLGDIRVLLEKPECESEKVLRERLVALDGQVLELRVQQRAIVSMLRSLGTTDSRSSMDKEMWVEILRESGMDEPSMERWHARFECNAPEAHRAFLAWLGIPEAEATRIRARARRYPRSRH